MFEFWWLYLILAMALFIFLLKLKELIKRNFTIGGEEDKIVEEINRLLEEKKLNKKRLTGRELEKEKKKIKKEIEVLVGKAEELIELSKEKARIKKAPKKQKIVKLKLFTKKPPKEKPLKEGELDLKKFISDVRKKLR